MHLSFRCEEVSPILSKRRHDESCVLQDPIEIETGFFLNQAELIIVAKEGIRPEDPFAQLFRREAYDLLAGVVDVRDA